MKEKGRMEEINRLTMEMKENSYMSGDNLSKYEQYQEMADALRNDTAEFEL